MTSGLAKVRVDVTDSPGGGLLVDLGGARVRLCGFPMLLGRRKMRSMSTDMGLGRMAPSRSDVVVGDLTTGSKISSQPGKLFGPLRCAQSCALIKTAAEPEMPASVVVRIYFRWLRCSVNTHSPTFPCCQPRP